MRSLLPKWLSCAAISLAALPMFGNTAQAAQFHLGWNYAIDSPNDSLGLRPDNTRQAGETIYEIGGIAFKDDVATDSIWFAISANLPLYGENTASQLCPAGDTRCYPVTDSNIGWGDLFLDFSGSSNLKIASDNRQLFGIRFAPRNDSKVPFLGVYSDVQITSVVGENAGYPTLANNNNMLSNLTNGQRTASMGDLAWNDPYFAPFTTPVLFDNTAAHMPNVIAAGTKIGEASLLGRSDLVKAGLAPDFFQANTSEIFGFRIPKALLPVGDFIATLLTECINDGVALTSKLLPPAPPPPTAYICPVTQGQQNALLPDRVVGDVKIFNNAPSGAWFDPPADMGFQFVTLDGSLFTGISNFPCAVAPKANDIKTAPFNVLVKNEQGKYEIIGQYFPDQSVDFTKILGRGVPEFIISGIDADAWEPYLPDDPRLAFPLLLDRENARIALRKIPDTTKLPIAEKVIPAPQPDPENPDPIPGYPIVIPGIPNIPEIIGPELGSPCLPGGSCNNAAVPEPSTIAGIAFAAAGLLKLRRDRRPK